MNFSAKKQMSKADLLFQKAFAAHNAGNLPEAESLYRQALALTPRDFETLYLLGTACSQQCKFDEATTHLKKALAIQPNHPEALNNMGLTLRALYREEEAIAHFSRALAQNPAFADAHSNLASALVAVKKFSQAEAHARQALQYNPNLPNAYYNLGLALTEQDRFEEAASCFIRGLELKPDYSAAYNDLGGVYRTWGRLQPALECFDRAIALNPQAFNSHNNRGAVYEEMGRFDEALAEYHRATEINPEDITAQWNSAYLYLRQGILDRGWEAHELRLRNGLVHDRFPYPTWDGSSLAGKTILIYAEQGLGDEIFYASCIPDVLAQAGHCIIECDHRLAPLVARSFPSATVHGTANRLDINWILDMPKIDLQIAVGSLPRYFRQSLDSFPRNPGYFVADPARVEYWRSRLALTGSELKVGICWRSGVTKGERHKHYSQLEQWGNIFGVPGVRFVNLQYDECMEELRNAERSFGVSITTFPELDLKNALDDTTALMGALDVVISAGTAVSELAAAIGVEVFRLDVYGKPMECLGTDSSPWHPSMRLFRQISIGDWDTPIALIGTALKEKIAGAAPVDYVRLACGAEAAVNGSLEDMPTYVLQEQGGWFDAEYRFIAAMSAPGVQAVDIGAGIGAYALALAMQAGNGRVRAYTRTASETELLVRSRARNGMASRLDVHIGAHALSLDAEMNKHGLIDIDLVRIADGFCTPECIAQARRFLTQNSPFVMLGRDAGDDAARKVAEQLAACGYHLYRLAPGLNVLAPMTSIDEMDALSMNFFACKPDRAELLEKQGLLFRQTAVLNAMPGIDLPYWQQHLQSLPYAQDMVATWKAEARKEKDWEIYWMALNLYAMTQQPGQSAATKHACLQACAGILVTLVRQQVHLPRVLSLCRVLTDLGNRVVVVDLLNQICSLLQRSAVNVLTEPCLALNDEFARMQPGAEPGKWVIAQVLAQRERLRAFSSYFTGRESLPALQEVAATGFADEDTQKRIRLIEQRFALH